MATLAKELERRLERAGVRGSARRIEDLILAAVDDLLAGMRPMDPLLHLTQEEQDALRRGGVALENRDLGENDPVLRATLHFSAMAASSLTVAQAASKLGIDESRVRHRLADRTLYGFKLRGGWLLPTFQFEDNDTIPGLELVAPYLSANLHPLEVLNWFSLPDSELVLGEDEEPVSPRQWLSMGRDPRIVATLAEAL